MFPECGKYFSVQERGGEKFFPNIYAVSVAY